MSQRRLDLGISDVHQPGALGAKPTKAAPMAISAAKRRGLPADQFALPETRQYPIDTAARVRNAAARLEQNKGRLAPEQYARAKGRIARAARRFGIESKYEPKPARRKRLTLAIRHPIHGRLEVNLRDGDAPVCTLTAPLLATDAGDEGPVWIQIARCGDFHGHPAGSFALNPSVFADICRNFVDVDRGQVAFDFEHASEMEPTDGTTPQAGAPAQGWIRQLDNRGLLGLWALVEWLEPARTYIREGKYRHVSPAIRFNARHPETGKPIGARLTSVALTNRPFLRGMTPIMATDTTQPGDAPVLLSAYSSHEFMPKLRACLKLGELATPAECSDALERVQDLMAAAGGNPAAMVQGVDLGTYTMPLRSLMNLPLHHTWEEVFKAVRALIEAAIAEHEVEHHSAEEEDEPPSSRDGAEGYTMSDKSQNEPEAARLLRDLQTKHDETARLLADTTARATKAEADLNALSLQAKAHEAELATLRDENKALKEAEDKRLASDRAREVDEAIAVHGKAKGIAAGDRDALLALLTASPDAFRKLYPQVDPAKRALMSDVSGAGADRNATHVDGTTTVKVDIRAASRALASQKGISLEAAQQQILLSQKGAR